MRLDLNARGAGACPAALLRPPRAAYRPAPPPNSLRYMRPARAIPARCTAIPATVAATKSPRADQAIPNAARDGAATIAATAVPLRSMSLDENGAAAPPPELPGNAPAAPAFDKNRRGGEAGDACGRRRRRRPGRACISIT